MKVYLAKTLINIPLYGSVYDLTQCKSDDVDSFDISYDEFSKIDESFIDATNKLCNAYLDYGDYQYYDYNQCCAMLEFVNSKSSSDYDYRIASFYNRLISFLEYAIENHTGIAIEL